MEFIDDAASSVDDRPIRGRRGGRRAGAGRPRRNPGGDPELNKQAKYWLITIFYTQDDEANGTLVSYCVTFVT